MLRTRFGQSPRRSQVVPWGLSLTSDRCPFVHGQNGLSFGPPGAHRPDLWSCNVQTPVRTLGVSVGVSLSNGELLPYRTSFPRALDRTRLGPNGRPFPRADWLPAECSRALSRGLAGKEAQSSCRSRPRQGILLPPRRESSRRQGILITAGPDVTPSETCRTWPSTTSTTREERRRPRASRTRFWPRVGYIRPVFDGQMAMR